jgi:hypothetical protein
VLKWWYTSIITWFLAPLFVVTQKPYSSTVMTIDADENIHKDIQTMGQYTSIINAWFSIPICVAYQ